MSEVGFEPTRGKPLTRPSTPGDDSGHVCCWLLLLVRVRFDNPLDSPPASAWLSAASNLTTADTLASCNRRAQNAWHVARGGQTYGPYTWEQIAEHARGGRIGRRDKILDPRSGVWTKPTQVPGLFGPGGVATVPVGISVAAKVAVGIILGLALVLGAVTSIVYMPTSLGRVEGIFNEGAAIVQANSTPVASQSAQMPPEGFTYKGTFQWESKEGQRYDDPCYLWVYTTDDGTAADFDFGTVDGWPLFLVSQSGSRYVFEMSNRSLVGRVKMSASLTDTEASGRITNIDWHADTFSHGTFTGTAIPYEQYMAERP